MWKIIAAVLLVFFFNHSVLFAEGASKDDEKTIEISPKKIKEEAEKVIEKTGKALKKAGEKTGEVLGKAGEKTGKGLKKAGEATGKALETTDKKIKEYQ